MSERKPRFPGLELTKSEQQQLKQIVRKEKLGMLKARRVQMLQLLNKGWNITATAERLKGKKTLLVS